MDVEPDTKDLLARTNDFVAPLILVVMLICASILALRNIRLGRSDRKTALRFALYLGTVRFLWMLGAHHIPSSAEIDLITAHLAWSLYRVGVVYIFYLALEPYARRLWPRMLVSWVRLIGGRFRDPLVGRDLLIGVLFGTSFALLSHANLLAPRLLGLSDYGLSMELWSWGSMVSFRHALTSIAGVHTQAVLFWFVGIMMLLVLRVLVRRTWIAVVLTTVLSFFVFAPSHGNLIPFAIFYIISITIYWLVLFRFGLLPILLGATIGNLLMTLPLTFDLTAWYADVTLLVLAVVLGITGWGFWVSLAGRPLFRDEILEDGGVR